MEQCVVVGFLRVEALGGFTFCSFMERTFSLQNDSVFDKILLFCGFLLCGYKCVTSSSMRETNYIRCESNKTNDIIRA